MHSLSFSKLLQTCWGIYISACYIWNLVVYSLLLCGKFGKMLILECLILQPKYYDDDYGKMLETLLRCKNTGCLFLVGGRHVDGVFKVCILLVALLVFPDNNSFTSFWIAILWSLIGPWGFWNTWGTERHVYFNTSGEISHGHIIHWNQEKSRYMRFLNNKCSVTLLYLDCNFWISNLFILYSTVWKKKGTGYMKLQNDLKEWILTQVRNVMLCNFVNDWKIINLLH